MIYSAARNLWEIQVAERSEGFFDISDNVDIRLFNDYRERGYANEQEYKKNKREQLSVFFSPDESLYTEENRYNSARDNSRARQR